MFTTLAQARPDAIDYLALALAVVVFLGLPIAGYVFMYLDIQNAIRRARNALMIVRKYVLTMPEWVQRDEPPCLQALGLSLPVTEEEVLAAYRERVKHVHPDAGGSRREFARLQQHFENAMQLARPVR